MKQKRQRSISNRRKQLQRNFVKQKRYRNWGPINKKIEYCYGNTRKRKKIIKKKNASKNHELQNITETNYY